MLRFFEIHASKGTSFVPFQTMKISQHVEPINMGQEVQVVCVEINIICMYKCVHLIDIRLQSLQECVTYIRVTCGNASVMQP